jgi:hypothetical protein
VCRATEGTSSRFRKKFLAQKLVVVVVVAVFTLFSRKGQFYETIKTSSARPLPETECKRLVQRTVTNKLVLMNDKVMQL